MALAGVALIGLPPSGAFLGKWQLLTGAFMQGQWIWILVMAIGSLLAAGYMFRMLGQAFGNSGSMIGSVIAAREEWPALLLGIIATLVLGLASGWLWPLLAEHR